MSEAKGVEDGRTEGAEGASGDTEAKHQAGATIRQYPGSASGVDVADGMAKKGSEPVTIPIPVAAKKEVMDGRAEVQLSRSLSPNFVAPALRVEELKDEEGRRSPGSTGTDEEGSLSGHGDGSDIDTGHTKSPNEKELSEFVAPNDELRDKIISQVEFYFSDANILKDAFLLKHVRRNKQGHVSLKLITSFRKVKSLTKDYRVVAYSLRHSDKLEVNDEGTKVRRIEPLPEWDETTPSRSVVAVNLPFENPTIENVAELFAKCGDIVLIRILRPGKPVPQDVKKHLNKHPEIGQTVCAVVEFEHHESAKKASEEMTNKDDWRKGLHVMILAQAKKDKSGKEKKDSIMNKSDQESAASNGTTSGAQKMSEEVSAKGDGTEISEAEKKAQEKEEKKNRRKANRKKRGSRVEELLQEGDSPAYYSSSSDAEGAESKDWRDRRHSAGPSQTRSSLSPQQDVNRLSPSTTPRNTPSSSPRSSPRGSPNMRRRTPHGKSPLATDGLSPGASPKPSPAGSPEPRRKNSGTVELGTSPSQSPWVQRRLKAQQEAGIVISSPGASPKLPRRQNDGTVVSGARMLGMEGIRRQPKGPDGTAGFHGRGKPIEK